MSEKIQKQENYELLGFDTPNEDNLAEINDPLLKLDLEERKYRRPSDYSAHRRIFPNSWNGSKFCWDTPFLPKEGDVQFPEFPNLTRKSVSAGDIIGVIGVPLIAKFGFIFWSEEDSDEEKKGPTCRTLAAYTRMGEDEKLIVDGNPLPSPQRQPHQSKAEYNKLNKDLKRHKSYFTLYGSRPPLDDEGNEVKVEYDPSEPITLENIDKRFRTCESCVHHQQHFYGEVNSKGELGRKADKCGMNGLMKFCVFAIAVLEEDAEGNNNVVYYNPQDYGIDSLQSPFVIQSLINKTAGLSEIGKGNFDVQINPNTNPLTQNQDGFVGFPTYLNWLKSTELRHQVIEGRLMFNALTLITPCEVQKDDPKEGGADYIPVFKVFMGGRFDDCLKRDKVIQLAYDIEQAEIKESNGGTSIMAQTNPVFEALKDEGFPCYDPDKGQIVGETSKSVKEEEETKESSLPSSNFPFKRSKTSSKK